MRLRELAIWMSSFLWVACLDPADEIVSKSGNSSLIFVKMPSISERIRPDKNSQREFVQGTDIPHFPQGKAYQFNREIHPGP